MRFVLALHTDDDQRYGVTVPDLPGCFSAGDSLDEALVNAREAIDGHVELLIEDDAFPIVHSLEEHKANPDLRGAVWAVLDVPVEQYFGPAEKINITVPKKILHKIDKQAKMLGESRSGFLVRAAESIMTEKANPRPDRRPHSAMRFPAMPAVVFKKAAKPSHRAAAKRK